MIHDIENLETKHKVKLSVPLIASYLVRGVKRTKIAEICNVSFQAVYDYCNRHYEELAPLIDTSDSILAIKSKHIAVRAQERILKHLNQSEKKDLFALNAISGTHIDKMRLLSDKSTSNVSIASLNANLDDLTRQEKELEAKLKLLDDGSEMGKETEIIDVDGECTP